MAVADDERVTLDELEPVDTGDPDELEITIDEDDEERDRRDSARELDGIVVARALEAATRSAPTNMRLATLETWRLDLDRWRLRLTGVDDTNGKIGKLGETIAELRRDVGDRKECERVRAAADTVDTGRKRAIAAVITAGLALGGAGWAVVRDARRDAAEATMKRMELELRVRNNERRLDELERRRTP